MSELDQLYQEFYEQVITRLKLEFELFQKEKPYLNKKEQVKRFKNLLGKTDLSTKDFPELVPKEIPGAVKETTILWLVSYFRGERNQYNHDPIFYFFQENEKRLSETFPTIKSIDNLKEILTKFFAQKEALANFKKEISIDHQDINKPIAIMSTKQTLSQWLANGENDRVVEALQTIANQFGDKYFVNEVTPIAGRFNSIKRDRQKGVISDEFYNIQMNQIRQALQDLIEDVPAHATLDMQSLPPVNSGDIKPTFTDTPINPTSDQPSTATTSDIISPKVSPHIPWIVGLALLLVSAITLAGFIPCPTRAQETIFRLLMAIGAGGVATILPGLLNINIQGVKAGSAVGVLALVYLVNPAKMIEDNSRCNKIPFEFTISLQPDQALLLSPQYPTLQEATLQIRLDNKWEDALIDANGDADYKSIPGDFKDQMVATRLNAKYWKLVKDSIALTGKSQILKIVPDGTLGVIQGKVFNSDGSDFLANAVIEIAGERDTTDAQGNFNLSIPVEKQQERYELLATKTGYELQRLLAYPASGAIQIRLEKKK